MATLLTLLESPGIHIALALGAVMKAREACGAVFDERPRSARSAKCCTRSLPPGP